jgi:hypothetical protein
LEQRLAVQLQLESLLKANQNILHALSSLERSNPAVSQLNLSQMTPALPFLTESIPRVQFSLINPVDSSTEACAHLHGNHCIHQSSSSNGLTRAGSAINQVACSEPNVVLSPEEERIIDIVSEAAAAMTRNTAQVETSTMMQNDAE